MVRSPLTLLVGLLPRRGLAQWSSIACRTQDSASSSQLLLVNRSNGWAQSRFRRKRKCRCPLAVTVLSWRETAGQPSAVQNLDGDVLGK